MSKLIGILGHKHSGTYQPGYGQNERYLEFFRQFGDCIIIDAQCEQVLPVDLLVLPGGADVNPLNYGEKPHKETQKPDLEYEWFFKNMFSHYVDRASKNITAIYGVCAGFQNLNVFFGGKVNQHIDQIQSSYNDRGELTDDLKLVGSQDQFKRHDLFDLKWLVGGKNKWLKTNSIHHQGVYDERYSSNFKHTLSDKFETLAFNIHFGNVEIIKHKELPIAAEQAHPEERVYPVYTFILIDTLLNNLNK